MASTHIVKIVQIEEIKKHPNADRLQLIRSGGWWCVDKLDNFKVGEKAIYIPPESIITDEWAEKWNITNYTSELPTIGGYKAPGRRVRATRLRGEPSFGVYIRPDEDLEVGTDVASLYSITKYEQREKQGLDQPLPNIPQIFKYTDIENIANFPEIFSEGEEVVITEKIHGTNSVVGCVFDENENIIYIASSHSQRYQLNIEYTLNIFNKFIKKYMFDFNDLNKTKINRLLNWLVKKTSSFKFFNVTRKDFTNLYSLPFKNEGIFNLTQYAATDSILNKKTHNVLIYSEIYGRGVQDMSYGTANPEFRVFDISIDGKYVNYDTLKAMCQIYHVPFVPELYYGEYSKEIIDRYVSGPTIVCDPSEIPEPFKGREGIVIKPIRETYNGMHRKIAKYISADYHSRRNENQTEYH